MELFSITCTTCNRRLRVRDAAAIGQILACPKCGSMVQVEPPHGWTPPVEPSSSESAAAHSGMLSASSTFLPVKESDVRSGGPDIPVRRNDARGRSQGGASRDSKRHEADHAEAACRTGMSGPPASTSDSDAANPKSKIENPKLPGTTARWRPWLMAGGLGALAAVAAVAAMFWFMSSRPTSRVPPAVVAAADRAEAIPPLPSPASDESAPSLAENARARWIPASAQLVFRGRFAAIPSDARWPQLASGALRGYARGARELLRQLDLTEADVHRVTVATADSAGETSHDLPVDCVAAFELAAPHPRLDALLARCRKLDVPTAAGACYELSTDRRPQSIRVVDPQTILVGPLDAIAVLPTVALNDAATELVLDEVSDSADLVVVGRWPVVQSLDFGPLRLVAGVWPSDRSAWRMLRDAPLAASFEATFEPTLAVRGRLACDGASSAAQVKEALAKAIAGAPKTIEKDKAAITEALAGRDDANRSSAAVAMVADSAAGLARNAEVVVERELVRFAAQWPCDAAALAGACVDASGAIIAKALASAAETDEANLTDLLSGLSGSLRAEGAFPAGAGGAALLPPETRLSWIASLLPYYGFDEWGRELNFGRTWNDAANVAVARRRLPLVLNPAVPQTATDLGFPVTHYVGMAGVGADAGRLDASDPRAGVFGYGRRTPQDMITDGVSSTIAVMGVSASLGPWSAGGHSTVRALTQRPYFDGPDGFGSGQPHGMFAGMADGSARFLSRDIDPVVLEQLSTIGGGEHVGVELPLARLALRSEPQTPAQPGVDKNQSADAHTNDKAAEPHAPDVAVVAPAAAPAHMLRVDVAERLSMPIRDWTVDAASLVDLARFVSEMTSVDVTLDLEGLADAGCSARDTVSGRSQNTTLGAALAALLETRGLAYVVDPSGLIVTRSRQADGALEAQSYRTGGDGDALELANILRRFVEPSSWIEAGGRGTIHTAGDKLNIEQTAEVQARTARLVTRLKAARASLLVGTTVGREGALATRYARAKAALATRVSANFAGGAALDTIASYLGEQAALDVVVDGAALAAAGRSPSLAIECVVADQPLDSALAELCRPLGLTFECFDERTVRITTEHAAGGHLTIEFYRMEHLAQNRAEADKWIDRIMAQVSPASWSEAQGAGQIAYDQASRSLIVLQPYAVHVELEQLLDAWRAQRTTP